MSKTDNQLVSEIELLMEEIAPQSYRGRVYHAIMNATDILSLRERAVHVQGLKPYLRKQMERIHRHLLQLRNFVYR